MAKLKPSIKSLEEVDEPLRQFYVKQADGTYEPDLDGDLTPGALRNAKAAAEKAETDRKALEDKLKGYGDFDPQKYKAGILALQNIQDENERKLLTEGKYEEVFAGRVTRMTATHENETKSLKKQLEDAQTSNKNLSSQLAGVRRESALISAINETGVRVRKGAMKALVNQASEVYQPDDNGKLIPRDANGGIMRGSKGEQLEPKEWLQSLAASEEGQFLFEAASGGGGKGSGSSASGGKPKVSRSDARAMGQHAEAISKGEVELVP